MKFLEKHKFLILGFLIVIALVITLYFVFKKPKGAAVDPNNPNSPTIPEDPTKPYTTNGTIPQTYDDTLQWVLTLHAALNPSISMGQSQYLVDTELVDTVITSTTKKYFQDYVSPLYKKKYGETAEAAINSEWWPGMNYTTLSEKHKAE